MAWRFPPTPKATTMSLSLHRLLPRLALAAVVALPAFAQAETLFSQPYGDTPQGGYWASTVEDKLHFDSFVLGSNARIESVTWWGMGIEEAFGLPPAHPSSFTVGIYADGGGGMPGALLSTTTIGNGANATNTGYMYAGLISVFSFDGALATPFEATAGTTYWIGIVDPTPYASWYWTSSAAGDYKHAGLVGGVAMPNLEEDLSFALHGSVSAVPEPASALLLALGAAGLLAARRRRG